MEVYMVEKTDGKKELHIVQSIIQIPIVFNDIKEANLIGHICTLCIAHNKSSIKFFEEYRELKGEINLIK